MDHDVPACIEKEQVCLIARLKGINDEIEVVEKKRGEDIYENRRIEYALTTNRQERRATKFDPGTVVGDGPNETW